MRNINNRIYRVSLLCRFSPPLTPSSVSRFRLDPRRSFGISMQRQDPNKWICDTLLLRRTISSMSLVNTIDAFSFSGSSL